MSLISKLKGDKVVWFVVLSLSFFSFLPIFSASSNFGINFIFSNLFKHVAIIIIGVLIMYTTHLIDYKYFKGLSKIILPLIIILLIFTAFQGNQIEGANASRWINIPLIGISFQPSSLASIFLLIYISNFLSKNINKKLDLKSSFVPLWLPILFVVMLILPSNFSTALMIFFMVLTILFLGQYPFKYIFSIILAAIFTTSLFVILVKNYPDLVPNRIDTWANRIENYINPSLSDSGYQINRAKAAIANGSLFGVGAGKSSMKYILPQSTSDFIFSIITEEYGLVVAISILFLYLILLFRIIIISYKSSSTFGKLISLSVGLPVVFQAFINMGVAVQLIPVTGQPLPLISMGGTSIWTSFLAFGILLSVSSKKIINESEPKKNDLKIYG
ncbi:MAG: cell division protein FtsW [Flavobacteriaceae bacterium]|nr:cell division protein FtsW [Flavobacteriaceae bacterium]|tara:strand:- start:1404 stop:2567 length:1164 start_codon:yes stop_codon:yes gene_type:complete